ncbi:RNA methyltransferase [Bifidobacterium sp. 82T10]|uniref:RNA methyltransferase n=1 Tax=Bifidobacterium miconis TaxID=2834435 RepID=A0ABS6WH26_9BIFI|nr:TrmH family RNA methyltransferase [Bifidobacterium miconis]MBW3093354.1 RNA methyltransferase [Bifidobacterium miconis]
MHTPNPVSLAAKLSGEPEFREVGVGPWAETHPGEPRPDDPSSPNFDARFDAQLLDDGDRRNVLDRYRYWTVDAIKADLDARGRHDFEVAVENWTHDFNIGSMVRTANAFTARRVHIVGPHKWNRKGALMTELYQHVENHPCIEELVECWRHRIAGEIAYERARAKAAAIKAHTIATQGVIAQSADAPFGIAQFGGAQSVDAPFGIAQFETMHSGDAASIDDHTAAAAAVNAVREATADIARADARIRELEAARVIALDIIPGAVPIETYRFPKRCLMLFGAEGPGLSQKALDLADDVVYISQFGSVRSINAGAAAAVAMHSYIAQHL